VTGVQTCALPICCPVHASLTTLLLIIRLACMEARYLSHTWPIENEVGTNAALQLNQPLICFFSPKQSLNSSHLSSTRQRQAHFSSAIQDSSVVLTVPRAGTAFARRDGCGSLKLSSSSASSTDINNGTDDTISSLESTEQRRQFQKQGIALALYASYFTLMQQQQRRREG